MGYPGAYWTPSPNFQEGRQAAITHVVFHTTEDSSDAGSLATLTDAFRLDSEGGRVSAHYLVARTGRIYHLVRDDDTAWTSGPANPWTINVEVVGHSDNPGTWSPTVVDALGSLTRWLSSTYAIPLVYRASSSAPPTPRGFVAHGAIQPANRYDPGPFFPWEEIQQIAAGESGASTVAPKVGALSGLEIAGLVATVAGLWVVWELVK